MHKVMIIEDDPTMLDLLTTLLQIEGFEVVRMGEPQSIIQDISREMPVLILLDVHLENELSGFDVLADIKQNPPLENIKIVMSSGLDFSHRCKEVGADAFVLKPYMPDELINIINQQINE